MLRLESKSDIRDYLNGTWLMDKALNLPFSGDASIEIEVKGKPRAIVVGRPRLLVWLNRIEPGDVVTDDLLDRVGLSLDPKYRRKAPPKARRS